MKVFDALIVGAAGAAIATIIISKHLNPTPIGGSEPNQGMSVQVPMVTDPLAAPIAQNTPITEAAYNTEPLGYEPAFGSANTPEQEAVFVI